MAKGMVCMVDSLEEEWEQRWMEAQCGNCKKNFEFDTEILDLDDEDPLLECSHCGYEASLLIIQK